jgi:predicted acyl esterase
MDLDLFAEHFTTHIPITALVYDNRGFGSSDGIPRFEVIPSLQMSDIQDAITYAQSIDEVNPEKIALWGSSYSGANVLQVGAFDRRVKAILAQAAMISGWENISRLVGSTKMPTMHLMFEAGISLPQFI